MVSDNFVSDPQSENQNNIQKKEAVVKKSYQRPTFSKLGNLRDLTQGGTSGLGETFGASGTF